MAYWLILKGVQSMYAFQNWKIEVQGFYHLSGNILKHTQSGFIPEL